MKKLPLLNLFIAFLVFGCASADHPITSKATGSPAYSHTSLQDNEYIYWINSLKATCVGVAPMQCLQVQKRDELTADGWQLFYDTIKGFKYKQGYIYKILVKEESIPPDQVPADASSKKYTLIKVLKKQVDSKLRLYDIWALETIKDKQLRLADGQQRPRLEINLKKMAVIGNDGCNDFLGRIALVDSKKLTFGPLAVTMKACVAMDIPNKFHQHIKSTQTYTIKGLKLYLFDNQGNELFGFKKID